MKILKELASKLIGIMNGSTFANWNATKGSQTTLVYTCRKDLRQGEAAGTNMIPALSPISIAKK
jgi:hypothetical protein